MQNQVAYFRGACRCRDPTCSVSIKAYVYLADSRSEAPGTGRILRTSGQCARCNPWAYPGADRAEGQLEPGHFDQHSRAGLRNRTGAVCHANACIQTLLTCDAVANVLRAIDATCTRATCCACRLALTERAARGAPAAPSASAEPFMGALLQGLGLDLTQHQDAAETMTLVLGAMDAPPAAGHCPANQAIRDLFRYTEIGHLRKIRTAVAPRRVQAPIPHKRRWFGVDSFGCSRRDTLHMPLPYKTCWPQCWASRRRRTPPGGPPTRSPAPTAAFAMSHIPWPQSSGTLAR